jgi:serine protease Do
MHMPNYFRVTAVFTAALTVLLYHASPAGGFVDDLRRTPVVIAVEKTKSAVVNISTHEQVYQRSNPFSGFRDPFFDRFFRDFFDDRYSKQSVRTHLGTGVIIDVRGYVVTNWHVIQSATSITVTTVDDLEFSATLVGADSKSDLAVLKIEAHQEFPVIPLGDSDALLIGETVIAIGNPFGLSYTVTTGVLSAINRSVKTEHQIYENFIQTDASINPGNSGGPLLNIHGELIGINTAIYGRAEGIGFAIPINTARLIVNDLLAYGEVRPPWIGISVQDLTPQIASHMGYSGAGGVIISDVASGSPAHARGIESGDILISIDDRKLKSREAYKRTLSLYTAGSTLRLSLFRQGKQTVVRVTAAEFPSEYVAQRCWDVFGFKYIDNSRQIARRYGLHTSDGIVISEVRANGQAFRKGLKPADVILRIQAAQIENSDDFRKRIVDNYHRDSVVLLVQRGPYGYYVTMDQQLSKP